jgi:hypothetical protein
MRHFLTGLALTVYTTFSPVSSTRPLLADDVTFQFRTTIDASPVGGPVNASLVATYTYDSNLQNGTGGFDTSSGFGSYAPIQMVLQVGDQCVTATGEFLIGDNWGDGSEDGYDVRFEGISRFDGSSASGQLFGLNVEFFRFVIVDSQAAMFSSNAVPVSPDFAILADYQQIDMGLLNPKTGEGFFLGFSEQEDTPPELKTPFTLTLIGDPVDLINDLEDDVVSLVLSQQLENGLLAKLDAALQALTDGTDNNDHVAINKLQDFINQVSAQQGKQISAADADLLIDVAEDIIGVLTVLLGC